MAGETSTTSYSTSLSTDTLYWDPHSDASLTKAHQHSTKSRQSYNSQTKLIVCGQQQQEQQSHEPKLQSQTNSHHHHHHHHHPHRYHVHTNTLPQNTDNPSGTHSVTNHDSDYNAHIQYIQQKPKSWDNLAMKAYGGYGFGYGYLKKISPKSQNNLQTTGAVIVTSKSGNNQYPYQYQLQQSTQNLSNNSNSTETLTTNKKNNSIPRKNAFGRYSTLDIENYAPPPSQFLQDYVATTPSASTKSTDNLLGISYNLSNSSVNSTCDCKTSENDGSNMQAAKKHHQKDCLGYYSHLPKNTIITAINSVANSKGGVDAPVSTNNNTNGGGNAIAGSVATISEITRL